MQAPLSPIYFEVGVLWSLLFAFILRDYSLVKFKHESTYAHSTEKNSNSPLSHANTPFQRAKIVKLPDLHKI